MEDYLSRVVHKELINTHWTLCYDKRYVEWCSKLRKNKEMVILIYSINRKIIIVDRILVARLVY